MVLQAVLEFVGPADSGKSSLVCLMPEALAPAHALFIDASPDQRLTQMLAPEPPKLTLAAVLQRAAEPVDREAIDWAFHDLTVDIGEDMDLLTVGPLTENVDLAARERLAYGLHRLMDTYDFVIVDGYHPVVHALLPDETMHMVAVQRPENLSNWQLPEDITPLRTPYLILNRYHDEPLPPALDARIRQGEWRLVGKLPDYPTAEDRIRQLSDDFRNCLLRMNIPLNLASSG